MAKCNTQANDKATTTNNWRTPGATNPGRYTNHQNRSQKPNSTAATFCIHEIPSWGLFRSSAEGASTTEGFYINTIAPPMKCE